MEINFIKDQVIVEIINGIIQLAGSNYNIPYSPGGQPSDASERNSDFLVQYQLPGGSSWESSADTSISESMLSAINSVLSAMVPFMSAYGLLLPVIGVIRGIIEVICALLNPFAVIAAVIRLFVKWIPPFIALFPPIAIIIIIINLIKIIISIILFILTVVVPIVQLIIENIKLLVAAFGIDGNQQQIDAGREKLIALIIDLLNQLGILNALKPIIEFVTLILGMTSGFPCSKGDEDATCCSDLVCPPVLKDPPSGKAILVPSNYGDLPPYFAWNLLTISGNEDLYKLIPYVQSIKAQLDAQLDEPVDEALIAGQDGDSANLRVGIVGKRGGETKLASVVKISGNQIVVIDPTLSSMIGVVDYAIEPNWEILVAKNVVGLGCHPDIEIAKQRVKQLYPGLPGPASKNIPDLPIQDDYNGMVNGLMGYIDSLSRDVYAICGTNSLEEVGNVSPIKPPYDSYIDNIEGTRDEMIAFLKEYLDKMKIKLGNIVSKAASDLVSDFDVDRTIVRSGADGYGDIYDYAIISVTAKDAAGSLLLKGMPDGVNLNINVYSNFGILYDRELDRNSGVFTAKLASFFPGTAEITAKIGNNFILEQYDIVTSTQQRNRYISSFSTRKKKINVEFRADKNLPARRLDSSGLEY